MEYYKNVPDTMMLRSSVSKREDMCFVLSYANISEEGASSSKLLFYWQIYRCRELIFSFPEIIASPVKGGNGKIYIIMRRDFYESGRVQLHLEKLNMPCGGPNPVTNKIFEACFRYTLVARISPLWSQVDCFLIQDRDFLLRTSPLNAIKFEVSVSGGNMLLNLKPLQIGLCHLEKSDVELIDDSDEQWVCVLPSLRKARVESVSSSIPASCPSRTYEELRSHWKNMYGFRLPQSSDRMFYCTLKFPCIESTRYTYPSVCMRQLDPVFLQHTDPLPLLQTFVANITSKIPAICGQPFNIESCEVCSGPRLCHVSERLAMASLTTLLECPHSSREAQTCAGNSVGGGSSLQAPGQSNSTDRGVRETSQGKGRYVN